MVFALRIRGDMPRRTRKKKLQSIIGICDRSSIRCFCRLDDCYLFLGPRNDVATGTLLPMDLCVSSCRDWLLPAAF